MIQPTDHQWAAGRVSGLPARWQRQILKAWERDRAKRKSAHWTAEFDAARAANVRMLNTTRELDAGRLPLDAKDSDICGHAASMAARVWELAGTGHTAESLRAAMGRLCAGQGIEAPAAGVKDGPALARLADETWWRRKLRRAHGKRVEGAAIGLGFVNRARECYVSNESLWRRADQNERNAATLDETIATNERGQSYTLAELAAKGPANKAIRRAELMTRISGFERIAQDMGHVGLFLTMTCPSRMHKWRTTKAGGVIENTRFDGTLPGEAQRYQARVWSRIRAKLARAGLGVYGFRIAEPNHDGTPHWHLLLFVEPGRLDELRAVIQHYALQDSPDEPGAAQHRVDFKPIDTGRGSAAGYIAKYVAKNIDGFKLDKDLIGNDAVEASHRVEAWAATWGIRQFQQIGGPPVGVWRELRRIESMPAGAPDFMQDAHRAVNKITDMEAGTVKAVAWDHYTRAMGGVFCGRKARITLAKVQPDGVNRYGEAMAAKPIGVQARTAEIYTPHEGTKAMRWVDWIAESTRHEWTITRAKKAAGPGESRQGAKRPWTCVNNCTAGEGRTEFQDGPGGQFDKENHEREHEWRQHGAG